MKKIVPFILMVLLLTGCTENERAKAFGGTMTVDLECGEKLFDITWKNSDFWYATRPMAPSDSAVTYTFREESNWGAMEGTVIINECK